MIGLMTGGAGAQQKRVALLVGPTQDRFIGTWAKVFSDAAPAKGLGGHGIFQSVGSSLAVATDRRGGGTKI